MRIVTIHGIRRKERWFKRFAKLRTIKQKGIEVLNYDYGYFNMFSFLSGSMRKQAVNDFITFYDEEIFEGETPSVICHSFGSYILYTSLLKQKTIKFDKVILCGCILKQDIDWNILFERGQMNEIYNDYGHSNEVVKFSSFIANCGNAGQKGFKVDPKLENRITQEVNYFGHSDYFTDNHMSTIWAPFLTKELPKFKYNKNLVTSEILKKVYQCDIHEVFKINSAQFSARVDRGRNYYGHYIIDGTVQDDNVDHYHFKTSADSTEEAEEMNLIACDRDFNLTNELFEDIRQYKSFKIYFDGVKEKHDLFYLEIRFQWLQTMSFSNNGDTDHWYIKGIYNSYFTLNFPHKLKRPSFVVFKNSSPITEFKALESKEKDGSYNYHATYKNTNNQADVIVFCNEGVVKSKNQELYKVISRKTIKEKEYRLIYCQDKQIDYVYDLEREIERKQAAHKTILKQRKDTFNEGFLIIVDDSDNVVSYLESIVWKRPHFEKFDEIKCFPLLHNINGNELYINFIATDPKLRKNGFGSWILSEAEKIALKYNVGKVSLVAKDNLTKWYNKSGYREIKELPEFLKDTKYKSIQMEKIL